MNIENQYVKLNVEKYGGMLWRTVVRQTLSPLQDALS